MQKESPKRCELHCRSYKKDIKKGKNEKRKVLQKFNNNNKILYFYFL